MRFLIPIAVALACTPAVAQQQNKGTPAVGAGLVCDSVQQLHRFVEIRNQGRNEHEAVRVVNDEAKNPLACGMVMAAFAPGKAVDKVKMLGEAVELVEITVSDGTGWKRVSPTTQYAIRTEPGIEI